MISYKQTCVLKSLVDSPFAYILNEYRNSADFHGMILSQNISFHLRCVKVTMNGKE